MTLNILFPAFMFVFFPILVKQLWIMQLALKYFPHLKKKEKQMTN